MTQITGITTTAKQTLTLVLPNGGQSQLYLEYMEGQQGWFYSISYGVWSATYRRLVVTANMLRAFRNIIPFGIGLMTSDGYEPLFINDFQNGRAQLFLLNQSDVATFEGILSVN